MERKTEILAKDRLRLIIGLARYLSTAVDLNSEARAMSAAAGETGERPPAEPRA
jgi:hypothetical protein